jgi:hypothetical protein
MEIIVAVSVLVWAVVGKENLITGMQCSNAIHRDPVIYPFHFTPCPVLALGSLSGGLGRVYPATSHQQWHCPETR